MATSHSAKPEPTACATRVARLGYWERDVETFEVNYSEETTGFSAFPRSCTWLEPTRLAERLHPEDRHIMLEAYERAVSGSNRYDVDYRVLLPDGARTARTTREVTIRRVDLVD